MREKGNAAASTGAKPGSHGPADKNNGAGGASVKPGGKRPAVRIHPATAGKYELPKLEKVKGKPLSRIIVESRRGK